MKKTYISPAALTVQLGSCNAMMIVSASTDLSGTSYGSSASSAGVSSADVKENKNIWDEEW